MEKYVAYYRVSTKNQGRTGLGLAAQKEIVERFIDDTKCLLAEYVEIESGRKDSRVILWRAIEHAKQNKARLVIAKLDRFSRRVSFISNLMEQNIGLTVAEMPSATDFQLHIFAALAQEERRLISERTKAALTQAKKQGKVLGRNGLVLAQIKKNKFIEHSKLVMAALGPDFEFMTFKQMVDCLAKAGVKGMNGGNWHPATLHRYINAHITLNQQNFEDFVPFQH